VLLPYFLNLFIQGRLVERRFYSSLLRVLRKQKEKSRHPEQLMTLAFDAGAVHPKQENVPQDFRLRRPLELKVQTVFQDVNF
jgi:hypothetical protein